MKILHIIQRYYPAMGGSELYMKNISEYLAKKNSVEVWTSDALDIEAFWDLKKRKLEIKNEVINNVLIRRFNTSPSILSNFLVHKIFKIISWRFPFKLTRVLSSFPYVFGMLRYALSKGMWDFDVIHVSSSPYNILFYIAVIIKKRSNAKLILSPFVHLGEGDDDPIRKYYFKPESAQFYDVADFILIQTDKEREAIVAFCKKYNLNVNRKKFVKVGIGLDIKKIVGGSGKRFRKKYEIKENEKIVFYIGAKRRDKGAINLIKSCILLWKKGKRFKLVVAGSPSLEFNNYFEKVRYRYKKNIVNIDNISDKDKFDLYDAGDIFSMVSRSDSFGIVYLESWIYKKPVIGCKSPAISEVISENSDGLLTSFSDISQISLCIDKLFRDKKLRSKFGNNGYKKVLEKYQLKDKLEAISLLYTHKV